MPPSGRWTYCIRLRQREPVGGGTSSTVTSRSSPASLESCSATTAAFSRRCSASVTCWKSQPPQAPGPAYGHGGRHPVRGRVVHLDRVGPQEPAVVLGDLRGHALPGQRVPDEDDLALVARATK